MFDWGKLLIMYLIIFEIVIVMNIIVFLYILRALNKINDNQKIASAKPTRRHTSVKTSNYNNSFNRRGYDQFKNEKTGLYEPQKPHQGIELKTNKEE